MQMKFDEFWAQLGKELTTSKKFKTLIQEKEFEAKYSKGKITIIPIESHFPRTFSKQEFTKVWNKASKMVKNEQFKPTNFTNVTYHSSYILALMRHILKNKEIE